MRLLTVILAFLIMPMALAQLQTEKTVSYSLKTTKADEVKPYLLFKATDEALKQYSTELGFNPEELKQNLEKKFETYFETYKQRKLTAKFGKNYSEQLTEDQKKEFLAGLESHREQEFIKFSRYLTILDGHSFKGISPDPKTLELWNAVVYININRVKLDNLIKRVNSNQTKQYARLNIISEINLIGVSWNELGLEREDSFNDPLMNSWGKWFLSNQPVNVEEINLCKDECLSSFEKWQQLRQDEGLVIEPDQVNDLWLKVSYNLRKLSYLPNLNEWHFEWSGRVVLLDANTKRILSTEELLPENKTWRGLDQKGLNSALASFMYRSPLSAFSNMSRKMVELPQLNRLSRLVIQGQSHLGDVLSLMDMLKKEGRGINLDLQLDLFTKNEAQLLCFYQGEEKSFSDLLSRPKELKSSESYRLVNEFTGIHHVLKLVAE